MTNFTSQQMLAIKEKISRDDVEFFYVPSADIRLIQTDDGKWGVINGDGSVIVDYEPSNTAPEESSKQINLKERVINQALKRLFMSLAI